MYWRKFNRMRADARKASRGALLEHCWLVAVPGAGPCWVARGRLLKTSQLFEEAKPVLIHGGVGQELVLDDRER
jgi:hypothetical protein